MDEIINKVLLALVDILKEIILKSIKPFNFRRKTFSGVMDLWYRGIIMNQVKTNDKVRIKCQISPYTQLFPNNPYQDANRWNQLYADNSKLDTANKEMHTIAFYIASDMAIRIFPKGSTCVVGLYEQYGYIGEGFIATIDKKLLNQIIPDFYNSNYCGNYVSIIGELDIGSAEHISIVSSLTKRGNLNINFDKLKSIPFIKIEKVKVIKSNKKCTSLLGTPWVATTNPNKPFAVRYCYFNNSLELNNCIDELAKTRNISVFFDDLRNIDSRAFSEKYMN